jgi:hypothetical protein
MSSLLVFIDWRYSQSCWYFRPSFVNYRPSNLLSGSPPHPSLLPKVKDIEWLREGKGVLSCVGDHIHQDLNTLFLNGFRNYKIAIPPQTKTYEGRGPQTDK